MKRHNFTLVEIIVSMIILSMILLVANIAIAEVYSSWHNICSQTDAQKQVHVITHIAETAFRNAVPFYWKNQDNKEFLMFSGTQHSLFLSYLHKIRSFQRGGIRFIKLYQQGNNLIAEYRQYPYLSTDTDAFEIPIEREVIASNIESINFIYVNVNKKNHELELFDEWNAEQMKEIPSAIQMEILFTNGQRNVWLRRTAGNGQFSEWGKRMVTGR